MKDTFVCFNNKQVQFVDILINLRFIKPTEEWGNKGVYYDTCEICGKRFDVFKGMFSFEGFIPDLCYTEYPANVIMCAGCFMVKYHNNLLR